MSTKKKYTGLDERSKASIDTLRPKARIHFTRLHEALDLALPDGITPVFTSGNRTWAEQDALYAKRPKVTNARGGFSNHNYGIAVDVTLKQGNDFLWESPLYAEIAKAGKKSGPIEWGGDWSKKLQDEPHYQLRVGKTPGQLRELVQAKDWAAVDSLIPDAAGELDEPVATPSYPVDIYLQGESGNTKLDITATFEGGSTYVDAGDFQDYFGDQGLKPALAPFSEVNAHYHLNYTFNGKASPKTLTILKGKEVPG